MPIPTLKIKGSRRAMEEIESPSKKSTMLPRATKLHAGGSDASSPHVTSQIPSPYQGHREGRQIRLGGAASKGTRILKNVTGPRPPPRTTSSLKNIRSSTFDRGMNNSIMKSPGYARPVAATRSVSIPGRVLNYQSQQYTNACSSNRSSVISNCSSNPAPSSSSSNRNSSSSLGSSFSIGSWNGTSETTEPQHLTEEHLNSGTFPRVKNGARNLIRDDNIPRATVEQSKLRMPNSIVQKNVHSQLKNKFINKPLSNSDSSIIGRPRLPANKTNYSAPNLIECSSIKKLNYRIKNVPEKAPFTITNRIVSYSSDSDDSKIRQFQQPKIVRDVKYRKENVASVSPLKPIEQATTCGSESKPVIRDPSKEVMITSPEDDDGYSSVAMTDQIEEDERRREKSTSFNDSTTEAAIQPMRPLKLLDSYSYLKCVGNGSTKPAYGCKELPSDVNTAADQNAIPYKQVATKCPEESPVYISDQESISTKVSPYQQRVLPVKAVNTFSSATIPKNLKFPSKSECPAVNRPMSKIDDSIYSVSYGKLMKGKPELINKQTSSSIRNIRKLGITENCPKKSIENVKTLTHPNNSLQISSMTSCAPPNIKAGCYSPRPNISKAELKEVPNNLDCEQQLLTRTKSLRYPERNEFKIELFTTKNCDENDASLPNTSFKTVSFPRGGNKYSTVIPRTAGGLKAQQNGQMMTFAPAHCENNELTKTNVGNELIAGIESEREAKIISLKMELTSAKVEMNCLTEEVNSKSKLLSAYEHSLTNMSMRLQHLSSIVEQKDIHIRELKKMVKKACLDGVCISSDYDTLKEDSFFQRGPSMESLASVTSSSSIMSYFSGISSNFSVDGENKDKKKKNWIRSSFSRAFKRKGRRKDLDFDSSSVASFGIRPQMYTRTISEPINGFLSLPSSPVPQRSAHIGQEDQSDFEISDPSNIHEELKILRRSLKDKECALTDTKLEVLSSAHQIDGLKESIENLSGELLQLKSIKRVNYAEKSKPEIIYENNIKPSTLIRYQEIVTKIVQVFIPKTFNSEDTGDLIHGQFMPPSFNIGEIIVSTTTTWKELYYIVERKFQSHLSKIDVENSLGVDISSIESLRIGDIVSTSSSQTQEFLPYGYFVGDVDWVQINLLNQSVNCMDEFAYETLIPKHDLLRYTSILQEKRRIILGGEDGTGKRYLAGKLAEIVIRRLGVEPSSINIAKFQVNKHTQQELSSYLCQINELCEARRSDLPLVIILESLNSSGDFMDLLSRSLKIPNDHCPYIICSTRVSKPETYELECSFSNFEWISLVSRPESSEGLLKRICRRATLDRSLVDQESKLLIIFEWVPRCFIAINSVLENASVDLIEPGAFLPLPKCLDAAQNWFSTIWKATALPKILIGAERCSNSQVELDTWKKLYSCLREDLPWSVFPNSCAANFPLSFKTIEVSC